MIDDFLVALMSLLGAIFAFAILLAGMALGFFALFEWQGVEFNVWAPVALTVAYIYAKALIKAWRSHDD